MKGSGIVKLKAAAAAAVLALGLLFPASAEYVVGPALSGTPTAPMFTEETMKEGRLNAALPVSRDPSFLKRARINAVLEVEKDRYSAWVEKMNETSAVSAEFLWNEGLDGADGTYTSVVLIESHYFRNAAHPMTYTKGYTFDSQGKQVPREAFLPDLTADEVWALTEKQCREKGIPLFSFPEARRIPSEYYLGKDRHLYLIYQLYDIAPYSSGFITVDMGIPERLKKAGKDG